MNDKLMEALEILNAAGGRLTLMDGRVRVDVDQELPESVWSILAQHRDELAASLGAPPPPAPADQDEVPWPNWPADRQQLPLPAGIACCDRCGATETSDSLIHGGKSIRRDCARCGRFRKFIVWHGVRMP